MSGAPGAFADALLAFAAAVFTWWATAGRGRVALGAAVISGVLAVWLTTQTDESPLLAMLSIVLGAAVGVAAAGVRTVPGRSRVEAGAHRRRGASVVVVVTVVATLLLGGWIGSNSPTESWFGAIVSHGPRTAPVVAITFDDGPNVNDTMKIAHLLDSYGVKGTFFSVGKALAKRPDISRALLADGHLLGNHSYHHDQWRWLDPRYPELERTQQVFRHDLGVCPAFYRPPHGEHTPFMAYALHTKHMTMVGWDVSAGDWATKDPELVARRVLRHVRAGSIIDLHDGLDGNLTADRNVLLGALPIIMRGLAAHGLHAVRLDQLLGIRGYDASHC